MEGIQCRDPRGKACVCTAPSFVPSLRPVEYEGSSLDVFLKAWRHHFDQFGGSHFVPLVEMGVSRRTLLTQRMNELERRQVGRQILQLARANGWRDLYLHFVLVHAEGPQLYYFVVPWPGGYALKTGSA